ncbi:UvrD-helicase domain-containing protein [Embleya sp. NPDC020886]|uniref:UvrD-helicase domain-containing protein n=1 Tax=Embleya sp. NPDC020886 TaxID=3363980 RepID=UPI0037BAFE58
MTPRLSPETPAPTVEQRQIIEQPARTPLFVTAGAGTGKTHTLTRRLELLVEREDLDAGNILVLTFSRAAVRELRTRLARDTDGARGIRVLTFDAWALEVLGAVEATVDWHRLSFDHRINEVTTAITSGKTDHVHADLAHVLIDEVQDLVGIRQLMVRALLERFDAGFTLVGDPAQAIYGFQTADSTGRRFGAGDFVTWLRTFFADELVELTLETNFRARTAETRKVLRHASVLAVEGSDAAKRDLHRALRTELLELEDFGDLAVPFVRDALSAGHETTAILCRDNGQALLIAEELHRGRIDHSVRRAASDHVVPGWVDTMLRSADPVMSRVVFLEALGRLAPDLDPDRTWRSLRNAVGRGSPNTLDLSGLHAAVAKGSIGDELSDRAATLLSVSTTHRAKGSEFDRVLVVDPGDLPDAGFVDAAEEARVLFVAMTRARESLYRLAPPEMRFVRKDTATGRWARGGPARHHRWGLEVRSGDVHTTDPAGTYGFEADPVALQEYLRTEVHTGDAVILTRVESGHRDGAPDGSMLAPHYVISHAGRAIGATSECFRRDLHTHVHDRRDAAAARWPRSVSRLRIDTVETVVGSAASAAIAGIGGHGNWLAPRLIGLGRFGSDTRSSGDATDD